MGFGVRVRRGGREGGKAGKKEGDFDFGGCRRRETG